MANIYRIFIFRIPLRFRHANLLPLKNIFIAAWNSCFVYIKHFQSFHKIHPEGSLRVLIHFLLFLKLNNNNQMIHFIFLFLFLSFLFMKFRLLIKSYFHHIEMILWKTSLIFFWNTHSFHHCFICMKSSYSCENLISGNIS